MKSIPSDGQTSDDIKQNINNVEVNKDVDPINTSPSRDSYTDLSSPKHSPFRQSLDEEHRAKARLRELEIEKLHKSKQLLRESIHSLSNAGAAGVGGVIEGASDMHQHDSILTKTEMYKVEKNALKLTEIYPKILRAVSSWSSIFSPSASPSSSSSSSHSSSSLFPPGFRHSSL